MIKYTLPKHLHYILAAYFVVICFFFLFRLVILPLNTEAFSALLNEEAQGFWLIVKAFIMGFRFDTVIACYVLAPVSLALIGAYFLNIKSLLYYKIIHYFTLIVFSICFIISLIDIPYFNFFFNRFTIQGLAWMDSPDFVFKMIVQDPTYLLSLVGLLLIISLYVFIMRKFFRHYLASQAEVETLVKSTLKTRLITAFVSIFLLGFLFLGIRGRLEQKSPIRVGTAYFSNNPLINQMGLNPIFTFIKSLEEKSKIAKTELNLMDKTQAQAFVKAEFERMRATKTGERELVFDKNTNVVLVMMESMGTCFIGDFGAEKLTPNLDQLIHQSVSYDNVYTAGIHTYNGVYSSLFGQPALMDKHTMHYTIIPEVKGGLHAVLKENGYNTYYYTTHDDQFDNIGGFLSANGAEKIVSVHDYNSSEVKSTMGVPDHVMFNKIIEQLNSRESDKAFFVSVLTGSFHSPFVLPEDISLQTKSEELKDKMIEYADWAIGKFIQDAKKSDWFDNTLFVFVADHGAYKGVSPYEIAMSYHHTPYLFYAPGKLTPKRVENIGLQIDTPAMIYSYLGIDNQQTLGIDFDIHPRKYAYFSANDKLGVLDEEYFYIWNRNGQEYLYKYKTKDRTNYIKSMPERANEMKQYGFAMLMN
jgi:phosphoglycerol transferase MdoB-like AlkP superfamily enzyme